MKAHFKATFLAVTCVTGLVLFNALLTAGPSPHVIASYQSYNNCTADIKFVLYADHSFSVDMRLTDEPDHLYQFKGTWRHERGEFICKFVGDQIPNVEALFASHQIEGEDSFRISLDRELKIYDILCFNRRMVSDQDSQNVLAQNQR